MCIHRSAGQRITSDFTQTYECVDPRDRLKVMTRTLERICSRQKHSANMRLWMFNFMVSKIASQVSSSSQRKLVRVTHVISKVLLLVPIYTVIPAILGINLCPLDQLLKTCGRTLRFSFGFSPIFCSFRHGMALRSVSSDSKTQLLNSDGFQ